MDGWIELKSDNTTASASFIHEKGIFFWRKFLIQYTKGPSVGNIEYELMFYLIIFLSFAGM